MSENENTPVPGIEEEIEGSEPPKRKRWRPGKNATPDPVPNSTEDLSTDENESPSEIPAEASQRLPFAEIDLDSLIPPSKSDDAPVEPPEPPKRRRGRPRKNPLPEPEPVVDPNIQKNLDLIANLPSGRIWATIFEICRKRWLANASSLTEQEIASLERATNDMIAYFAPNLAIAWPVVSFFAVVGTVFAGKYYEHKIVTESKAKEVKT